MNENRIQHYPVVIVGGGQAGLSTSYHLREQGIDHLVFEKHKAMHAWQTQRWDNFCLVTPNWQCALPGHPYQGGDPDGFMVKHEILDYLAGFRAKVDPPIREGVTVRRVIPRSEGGFLVSTTSGEVSADNVVVASGGYHEPIVPRMAERLPSHIAPGPLGRVPQRRAASRRRRCWSSAPASPARRSPRICISPGARWLLAVGHAPRCARFYRGRDVVTWLADMGYYEMSVDQHPLREGVRDNTNHYVTGRDGGATSTCANSPARAWSSTACCATMTAPASSSTPTSPARSTDADRTYSGINAAIDKYIAENGIEGAAALGLPAGRHAPAERPTLDLAASGIASIVWCIGFKPDFRWLDAPVFNGAGHPQHRRGITAREGIYFIGLPWLHTWGSGRFGAVGRDAEHIVAHIAARSLKESAA